MTSNLFVIMHATPTPFGRDLAHHPHPGAYPQVGLECMITKGLG